MTAYVTSRWDRLDYQGPLDPAPARKWLEAIKAAHVQSVDRADLLAWIAYRAGDFAAAEEWLRRDKFGPMANWIRAKLLLRAGKLAEAEQLLAMNAGLPFAPGPDVDPFLAYENRVQPALRPRLEGEQGAAQLAKGDYTGALFALLDGGYWTDAAYVAERVLSTDELRKYVDKAWPPALAAHRPDDDYGDGWTLLYGGFVKPSKERTAYRLRHLLGRRLVREGRYEEASAYLPKPLGLQLKTLARSMAEGRDVQRPAAERARALFRAACVTRHQGMELLGTELEPDWFVYEGQYENESYAQARTAGKFQILGPSKDERERAGRTRAEPWKRFHYRYQGADLAREAAGLLPDGSEEKARILMTAGNWLEGRDPEAARPFLAALLSCCGQTEIGRRAKGLNAIPNLPDACEVR
jgi:hypothetical protein